jgi:hypothetical protein
VAFKTFLFSTSNAPAGQTQSTLGPTHRMCHRETLRLCKYLEYRVKSSLKCICLLTTRSVCGVFTEHFCGPGLGPNTYRPLSFSLWNCLCFLPKLTPVWSHLVSWLCVEQFLGIAPTQPHPRASHLFIQPSPFGCWLCTSNSTRPKLCWPSPASWPAHLTDLLLTANGDYYGLNCVNPKIHRPQP